MANVRDVIRATRRYLSIPACVVALSVAGTLFVGDPTGTALVPFFVAVLGVSGHALWVGASDELASATMACVVTAVVVALLLGVAAALAGDTWSAGAGDIALSATLTVVLLVAYPVARRGS